MPTPSAAVDRSPSCGRLPPGLPLLADVAAAADDLESRRIVEDCMGANVGLGVAARVLGVGPRQVQRLARRQGGLNVPDMSRLWRSERSMKKVRETLAREQAVDWAAHALEAGYADQSHLVRGCKQFSGRTPGQILQQARQDEADWFYRLWSTSFRRTAADPTTPEFRQ